MKSFYPGDPEFTFSNYPQLPYSYVMLAYINGVKLYQERLHDSERPISMISSILANQHRDPKKSKKQPSYIDFCFYKPRTDEDSASYVYGSAYMKLIKDNKMPGWALFCFKDLSKVENKAYTPKNCALIAEDAMLLHPVKSEFGWTGLLIAKESASGQVRDFISDTGEVVRLNVPQIHTKVIAEEDVTLS